MNLIIVAAYLAYLIFTSLIFVIIYSKFGDFRRATTVALIIAKMWLAVYSLIKIDVPLWVIYSKKTHAVLMEVTFNEIQFVTLLFTNLWLNRDTIIRIIQGKRP